MEIALEPKINSYVSAQELLDYFAVRLNADTYTDNAKNWKATILATTLIDQLEFIGTPSDIAQPLQWPRSGIVNRNGQAMANDSIVGKVKDATCEFAFFLLRYDITDPVQFRQLYKLNSQTVGSSKNTYKNVAVGKLPDFVMELLNPYLLDKSKFSTELIA